MKKTISIIGAILLLFISSVSFAATPLKYRYEMFDLMEPSNAFDHGTFVQLLDHFKSSNDGLMTDDYYNRLSALGSEALSLEALCDIEDDVFDNVRYIWYKDLHNIDESNNFVVYLRDGSLHYSAASTKDDDWLSGEKFVLSLDTGETIQQEIDGCDFKITSDRKYIESYVNSCNDYSWEDIEYTNGFSTIKIRFYGMNEKFLDYDLNENEVMAFNSILRLNELQNEIRDVLMDWCRSIDNIESPEPEVVIYGHVFGDTIQDVIASELEFGYSGTLFEQTNNLLSFKTALVDFDVLLTYNFSSSGLYKVQYTLNATHSDNSLYITDYLALKDLITNKYGDAAVSVLDVNAELSLEKRGEALSKGYLSYSNWFQAENADIYINMRKIEEKPMTTLSYVSTSVPNN